MSQNLLAKSLARATQLMNNPSFNAAVEAKAGNFAAANKIKGTMGGGSIPNASAIEAQLGLVASAPVQQQYNQGITAPSITNESILNSKLAPSLKESFMQIPPQSAIAGSGQGSGSQIEQIINGIAPQAQQQSVHQITEQRMQPVNVQSNGAIDYSIIKMLIDESISRNLESIKQSLINENTVRAFKLGDGKIQFLDRKGNLYEGELKLKKKAENMKK